LIEQADDLLDLVQVGGDKGHKLAEFSSTTDGHR
jgi:hypothetical protein